MPDDVGVTDAALVEAVLDAAREAGRREGYASGVEQAALVAGDAWENGRGNMIAAIRAMIPAALASMDAADVR